MQQRAVVLLVILSFTLLFKYGDVADICADMRLHLYGELMSELAHRMSLSLSEIQQSLSRFDGSRAPDWSGTHTHELARQHTQDLFTQHDENDHRAAQSRTRHKLTATTTFSLTSGAEAGSLLADCMAWHGWPDRHRAILTIVPLTTVPQSNQKSSLKHCCAPSHILRRARKHSVFPISDSSCSCREASAQP